MSKALRILVTGASGQLGSEIALIRNTSANFSFFSREELDICSEKDVKVILTELGITHLINCAAYTLVDQAEEEIDKAMRINADAPGLLARLCQSLDVKLLHISTDYVFDGTGSEPYTEQHQTRPVNAYGASKLAGEKAILAVDPAAMIVRTSWLYSSFGSNFLKTMLRLAEERKQLKVVSDQWGSPTYAADLARLLVTICEDQTLSENAKGIFHFANVGATTWADFARAIMRKSGKDCKVLDIPSSAYPTLAKRPFYSVLNKQKIQCILPFEIPSWGAALDRCLSRLKAFESTYT